MQLRFNLLIQQHFVRRDAAFVTACSFLLVAACSIFFWLSSAQTADVSRSNLESNGILTSSFRSHSLPQSNIINLPRFDSAVVATSFYENVRVADLVGEEVSYSLDSPRDQPFQRYRIRHPVKAEYAKIRRFVAAIVSDMPNVTLDSIRCTRENLSDAVLACDLNFSAFFLADNNG